MAPPLEVPSGAGGVSFLTSSQLILLVWGHALGLSVGRDGEGTGTPLHYSCLKNPTGGGAWWAAVHGVAKSQAQLSDFPFTFHFPALEKEMATHSSVLAWRIPGRGEPGGLPSRGSQSRTQLKRLKQQQREGNRAQRCCSRLLGRSSQRIRTHTWQV